MLSSSNCSKSHASDSANNCISIRNYCIFRLLKNITKIADKKQKEPLRIELDKRKGKPSTLITDFMGSDDELKELTRLLKVKCSAGGSCRDGEILIQGDFRKKTAETLVHLGYKIRRISF